MVVSLLLWLPFRPTVAGASAAAAPMKKRRIEAFFVQASPGPLSTAPSASSPAATVLAPCTSASGTPALRRSPRHAVARDVPSTAVAAAATPVAAHTPATRRPDQPSRVGAARPPRPHSEADAWARRIARDWADRPPLANAFERLLGGCGAADDRPTNGEPSRCLRSVALDAGRLPDAPLPGRDMLHVRQLDAAESAHLVTARSATLPPWRTRTPSLERPQNATHAPVLPSPISMPPVVAQPDGRCAVSLAQALDDLCSQQTQYSRTTIDELYAQCMARRRWALGKEAGGEEQSVAWTERYRPRTVAGVLGNAETVEQLRQWLQQWKMELSRAGGTGEGDECSSGAALPNMLLLTGPYGCGKSAAVFACAEELGLGIIELNSGSLRTGRYILNHIGESTQSQRVGRYLDGGTESQQISSRSADESPSQRIAVVDMASTAEESRAGVSYDQSLVVLDDVDAVFEEDHGFWAAVASLQQAARRPIVLLSNGRSLPMAVVQQDHLRSCTMQPPPISEMTLYAQIVLLCEGLRSSWLDIQSLVMYYRADLRRLLWALQFWSAGLCSNSSAPPDSYPLVRFRDRALAIVAQPLARSGPHAESTVLAEESSAEVLTYRIPIPVLALGRECDYDLIGRNWCAPFDDADGLGGDRDSTSSGPDPTETLNRLESIAAFLDCQARLDACVARKADTGAVRDEDGARWRTPQLNAFSAHAWDTLVATCDALSVRACLQPHVARALADGAMAGDDRKAMPEAAGGAPAGYGYDAPQLAVKLYDLRAIRYVRAFAATAAVAPRLSRAEHRGGGLRADGHARAQRHSTVCDSTRHAAADYAVDAYQLGCPGCRPSSGAPTPTVAVAGQLCRELDAASHQLH